MPMKNAHFWGRLNCEVNDYNGCRLIVERIHIDGENGASRPEFLDAWQGILHFGNGDAPHSGGGDYFQLSREYPVPYGIQTYDDSINQIMNYRDRGIGILVWGK